MTTPLLHSLLGGALIGGGAAVLLLGNGRVAGISGIASAALRGGLGEHYWRIAFLLGLLLPALVFGVGTPRFAHGLPWLAASGLLVGIGTQVGSGCTSGHGVCGLANVSLRSLVATLTFMAVAVVTVFLVRPEFA